MLKNHSLAFKISLYIIACITVIFASLFLYNYNFSKQIILKESQHSATLLANSILNKIDNVFQSVQKSPSKLLYMIENTTPSENEVKFSLRSNVYHNEDVFASCVAYEPGLAIAFNQGFAPYYYRSGSDILYKNLADTSYDYRNHSWYSKAKETEHAFWTDPYFDDGGGDILMTTYSLPFFSRYNDQNLFAGVITADLSLEWLTAIIDSLRIYETGYAFLITKDGQLITHPHSEIALNESFESLAQKFDRPDLLELKKQIVNHQDIFIPFKSVIDNKDCWLFCSDLDKEKWSVCVVLPMDELFGDLNKLYWNNIILGIVGILVIVIVILIIARNISRPLRRLTSYAQEIGQGKFNLDIDCKPASKELSILQSSIVRMQIELKDYVKNLAETTAAKEKIDSELKIAHDIQLGMIPKIFPPFPHRDDLDLYAVLVPARQVGGDLYDFFFFDENKLCFVVGDVSDKGVPASLMMAITVTLFRAKGRSYDRPVEIMRTLNADLCKDNENLMFVTCFIGVIDLISNTLTYCNAGHNYPIILSDNGSTKGIECTHGTPLGVYPDQDYDESVTSLMPGDKLLVYTDGVVEALNINDDVYGDQRLNNILKAKCGYSDPKENINIIINDVFDFADGADQSDDITIMEISLLKQKIGEGIKD